MELNRRWETFMELEYICMGCMADKGENLVCPYCGWMEGTAPESTQHLPARTVLNGHYLVGRVLGHGGFGVTYLAWDMNLNVRVAIKEFLPKDLAGRTGDKYTVSVYSMDLKENFNYGIQKFLDEARMLARFGEHPNIVTIRDFFSENGTAYFVMNYVDGITFKQYIKQNGDKIPVDTALEIMMPVMDALREIHRQGMLHRDISPDNIYITKDRQVRLLDFGAARSSMNDFSRSLALIMKPGYSPEEQYRSKGKQGPWTDIYSVAATLYRAITGIVPPESMDRLEEDTLLTPSQLGIEIDFLKEQALIKALSVRAKDRYQSIEEFQNIFLYEEVEEEQAVIIPQIETEQEQIVQPIEEQILVPEPEQELQPEPEPEPDSELELEVVVKPADTPLHPSVGEIETPVYVQEGSDKVQIPIEKLQEEIEEEKLINERDQQEEQPVIVPVEEQPFIVPTEGMTEEEDRQKAVFKNGVPRKWMIYGLASAAVFLCLVLVAVGVTKVMSSSKGTQAAKSSVSNPILAAAPEKNAGKTGSDKSGSTPLETKPAASETDKAASGEGAAEVKTEEGKTQAPSQGSKQEPLKESKGEPAKSESPKGNESQAPKSSESQTPNSSESQTPKASQTPVTPSTPAVSPPKSTSSPASPTKPKDDGEDKNILSILSQYIQVLNNEDISGFMGVLDENAENYMDMVRKVKEDFVTYDLEISSGNVKIVSKSASEAVVQYTKYIKKTSGPAYPSSQITEKMTLRKGSGSWKIVRISSS